MGSISVLCMGNSQVSTAAGIFFCFHATNTPEDFHCKGKQCQRMARLQKDWQILRASSSRWLPSYSFKRPGFWKMLGTYFLKNSLLSSFSNETLHNRDARCQGTFLKLLVWLLWFYLYTYIWKSLKWCKKTGRKREMMIFKKMENLSFGSDYFMQNINHYHVKLSSRCIKIRALYHANSCWRCCAEMLHWRWLFIHNLHGPLSP